MCSGKAQLIYWPRREGTHVFLLPTGLKWLPARLEQSPPRRWAPVRGEMTSSPSSPHSQGRSRGRTARTWLCVEADRGLVSCCSHHRGIVFLLSFCSYSLFLASRKTFRNVKVSISSSWTPSYLNSLSSSHMNFGTAAIYFHFLGTLDTIFLFSCAEGLFVSGMVVFEGFLLIVICIPCVLSCVQQMTSYNLNKIMALQVQTVLALGFMNPSHKNQERGRCV